MTSPGILCRIEYLRSDGSWGRGHGSIGLLDPQRYAERLQRPGRVIVLDSMLAASDEVYYSEGADLL